MYKTTTRHYVDALDLAASASVFKDQVRPGLERLFARVLREGEQVPDFNFAQELIGRLLTAKGDQLQEADTAQTRELISTAALRVERNALVDRLRKLLRDARNLFDRTQKPAVARSALAVRRLSNLSPSVLLLAANDAVSALRDPGLGWADLEARFIVPEALAATIEAEAAKLVQVLDQLAAQKRSNQAELAGKLADIDAATETNRRCGDFLYGLYRLAGLDFHAERLRP